MSRRRSRSRSPRAIRWVPDDRRDDGRGGPSAPAPASFLESRARERAAVKLHPLDIWERSPSPPPPPTPRRSPKRHRRRSASPSSSSSSSRSDRSRDARRARKAARREAKRLKKEARRLRRKAKKEEAGTTRAPPDAGNADEFGPAPAPKLSGTMSEREYGGALLPGEGSAIASYVQAGQRIPRRGEVGLTSTEIERYETLGYVMSGSRHHRMNEVRMRKEAQVYSAEAKRAMALVNAEESKRKEAKLIADLRQYLDDQRKPTAGGN
ncbi:unnamed protein product (mitochondrion) [Plasmodiophora brassicae]|uniref:NF-kappa-B-activating protein C-terminal domain-containing protein n=1 Tax=Plasmodiophora brassicae TaxID=37360 RepID=A0A0G4INL4_PLABS|nr:hypothetical protein PBRA_005430 [Plasmodiophora brassicae]SPR01783.1 unnamed protein product [Plasmodiophora brassicae]